MCWADMPKLFSYFFCTWTEVDSTLPIPLIWEAVYISQMQPVYKSLYVKYQY